MLLMTACCLIGQAQTATTAKKAIRLAPNTPIIDFKTGEVIKVTASAPSNLNNISGSLAGPNSFGNTGSTGSTGAKTMKSYEGQASSTFTVKAGVPNQNSGSSGNGDAKIYMKNYNAQGNSVFIKNGGIIQPGVTNTGGTHTVPTNAKSFNQNN